MNQRDPRFKLGRTDEELNLYSKYLFFLMASLAFLVVFVAGLKEGSVI